MKTIKTTLFILAVVIFSSCSVSSPHLLTNNAIGKKVGTSSTACLFSGGFSKAFGGAITPGTMQYNGIQFNKDFSVYDAAKKGGISKIASVDLRYDWYFFFSKKTYIVTGE